MNFGVLLLLFSVGRSNSFLLDDRTTTATVLNTVNTVKNFDDLVAVVFSEREARLKLEKRVTDLEKELLLTQQGLTEVYHDNQRLNATVAFLESENTLLKSNYDALDYSYKELKANVTRIDSNIVDQRDNITSLVAENAALKIQYHELEFENMELVMNYTKTGTEVYHIKEKCEQLNKMQKQLQNDTNNLEYLLKDTTVRVDRIVHDNIARKDDYVGLYNKAISTETKLTEFATNTSDAMNRTSYEFASMLDKNINELATNTSDAINRSSHEFASMLAKNMNDLGQFQNQTAHQLRERIASIDHALQITSTKLDSEIHSMSGRVSLTICATTQTYRSGSKVLFSFIYLNSGVSDSNIYSLRTSGNYITQDSGLYLISAQLRHGKTPWDRYFYIYRNTHVITSAYFYQNEDLKSTAVVATHWLNKDDVIYVQIIGDVYIQGNYYSCLTLLQLSSAP